jgi:soluble lytic murein transglycosylase
VFYAAALALTLTFGNNATANAASPVDPAAATGQVPFGAAKSSQPLSQIERDWLNARAAFERRDIAALETAKERFDRRSDFVLAPYVRYWWISAQFAQSAQFSLTLESDITRLIAANGDAPFVDQLRRDHLRALGKLESWSQFARFQAGYTGDDNEVACQRLRYRYQLGGTDRSGAVADARSLLLTAKPAAPPCYDLFDKLVAAQNISEDDLWRRARPLFDAGQLADARQTVALIPNTRAGFEASTAAANLDPRQFLSKSTLRPEDRAQVELTLFAITRLARTAPEAAAYWVDKNTAKLPKSALSHAWAQIGLHAAMQLQPDALTWFANARAADNQYVLNDQQAGWLVRAALRESSVDPGQWTNVRRTITEMSETERRDPTWRYWLARSMATSTNANDLTAARVLRETLSRENHFYGVMATEELGLSIKPNFQSVKPADDAIAKLRERAAVKRAFALYRLADLKPEIKDLRGDALREWVVAMRNADDETLLAGAEIARQQGLPDRAINTAERTKNVHDFSQRYPLPHREPLKSNAATFGLDEAWIYGLIRQESRFMTEARSSVGAIGLMQLMPTTAKWAAKQVGVKDYSANRVSDVGINLSVGSFYLKHVLDDLGHPVLATAAYNAGPGRARRWRATVPLEGAIYAESIPFNETRDYVKKVMLNKWYYGHRIHGKSASLSELMGVVPAKPGATIAGTDRTATTSSSAILNPPNPSNPHLAAVTR